MSIQEARKMVEQKLNKNSTSDDRFFDNDEQYFYAVGQLVRYFHLFDKTKTKMSAINPYLISPSNELLRRRICNDFTRYNNKINMDFEKFNKMLELILKYPYEGEGRLSSENRRCITAGYIDENNFLKQRK